MPELKTVFYRQDNAGCYHCVNTIVCLKKISEMTGVDVKRMNFSDPQGGKGCCDRKAASIKSHIRIYLNEGHDVENIWQMKQAIESRGGNQGVIVFIVSVNKQHGTQKLKINDEKISLLNNFELTVAGIRVWRAYNIGTGRCIDVTESADQAVVADCQIIENPTHTAMFTRMKPRKNTTHADDDDDEEHLFCCPEDGCIRSFSNVAELDFHISGEKHDLISESDSLGLLDRAKLSYATKLGLANATIPQQLPTVITSQYKDMEMGWGLKTTKKTERFSRKQTTYLLRQFQCGEETGNKVDANDVAKNMRREKDLDGKRVFSMDEYLTARQISSFFSLEK